MGNSKAMKANVDSRHRFAQISTLNLRILFLAALTISMSSALDVRAGQASDSAVKPAKTKAKASQTAEKKVAQVDKQEVTGSHLAQPVDKHGPITTGMSPMVVVDQDMIRRSGGSTLSEVLRRSPGVNR